MSRIAVVGAALGGLAAAVRLAKVGHEVVLFTDGEKPAWPTVADPDLIELPAAWRDLFRKSGRILDAALAQRHLTLVPVPTQPVELDGDLVDWPTERGEQFAVAASRYGTAAAERWRDLLDDLVDTWQVVRRADLEYDRVPHDHAVQALLDAPRTVEDLARRIDSPLAGLVLSTARDLGSDPAHTPFWIATRLAVRRTFGLWRLRGTDGEPVAAATLIEVLLGRLADRSVEVRPDSPRRVSGTDGGVSISLASGQLDADAAVSAVDLWRHADLLGRRPISVTHPRRLGPLSWPGPPRPLHAALRCPDPHPAWDGANTAAALLPIRDPEPRVFYAGCGGLAGPLPWARVLAGAAASYLAHEAVTGDDIRPTNRRV